jgi:hypothetical protein
VVFSVVGGFIKNSFSNTGTLRTALDAALNPAVAGAANNKAIMAKIYDSIVGPIKANLPAGVDLSDATTRHGIVDKVIESIDPNGAGAGTATTSLDGNTSFLNHASHALSAPFLNGFSEAMVRGFWVSLVVVVVAFILSFFLKATPLRQKSALQEVADADAAISAQLAAEAGGAMVAPDYTTGPIDVVDADAVAGQNGPATGASKKNSDA